MLQRKFNDHTTLLQIREDSASHMQEVSHRLPRVLILNWRDIGNPLAGGAETHIQSVFSRLAQYGWQVRAISAHFPGCTDVEDIEGITTHRCGGPYHYPLALPWAYWRVAREFQPDIVIDFMNKLPLFTPLYVKKTSLCFVHHLFGSAASRQSSELVGVLLRTLEGLVPHVYANTALYTGSESTRLEMKALGVPESQLRILPYGVDTEFFHPGRKASKPTILYLGRLKRYKGVDHLLRAVHGIRRSIPDIQIDIAGVGEAEDELCKLARALGLEKHVHFHGWVNESAKRHLLQKAWVTCLPSCKEGFGLTIPEAALCDTPSVGYDVPGVRDAIIDGETGLLARYPDWTMLAEKLEVILRDETLRIRLGTQAKVHFKSQSWEAVSTMWEKTLLDVVRH